MDNPTRPIGTLESTAICAGVAAFAGVGSALMLMFVWDWSILQGIFGGFVVAAVLTPVLIVTLGRPYKRDAAAPDGDLKTRDVVAEAAAKRDHLVPRNVNAPSPHKDSVDYSLISDPRTDKMDSPRVNKALGGETPSTRVVGETMEKPASKPAAAPKPAPTEPAKVEAAPDPGHTHAPQSEPAPTAPAGSISGADVPTGQERKPEALASARDGKPDDLKKIKGVGPKLEKVCNELGFYHYDQIAKWSAEEVAWVDQNLTGFKGRVTRDDWVAQARLLATGGETAFSKKVDEGGVY
ncbi:MAG: hypothetical protein AAF366_17700 [Pseudomonadota bacterium]